jgi:hypothetical protein
MVSQLGLESGSLRDGAERVVVSMVCGLGSGGVCLQNLLFTFIYNPNGLAVWPTHLAPTPLLHQQQLIVDWAAVDGGRGGRGRVGLGRGGAVLASIALAEVTAKYSLLEALAVLLLAA